MSTPLFHGRITGQGGDHDTDSAHLLQSEVIERSLPEAHRPRGLSLERLANSCGQAGKQCLSRAQMRALGRFWTGGRIDTETYGFV